MRQRHESNRKLIQIMRSIGLDTRPDHRKNEDLGFIADLCHCSIYTIVGWICPPHWKKYRKLSDGYLELIERKINET